MSLYDFDDRWTAAQLRRIGRELERRRAHPFDDVFSGLFEPSMGAVAGGESPQGERAGAAYTVRRPPTSPVADQTADGCSRDLTGAAAPSSSNVVPFGSQR